MANPTSPVPIPQQSARVTGTTPGVVTTVYAVFKATNRVKLLGITATNIETPGTMEQVWIGIRYLDSTGTSDWEPLVAPYLNGGDVFCWSGFLWLSSGDEVVAYGASGDRVNVMVEVEEPV